MDPIDWTIKEDVRAKLKVLVKRILRKYGYPPDMQKLATETVLKQAEKIADEFDGCVLSVTWSIEDIRNSQIMN